MRSLVFRHKRLLIGLAVAAVLLLAAALVAPHLVNLDRYAQLLADGLSSGIGSPVTIKSGRFAILPDISFVVSDIELPEVAGPLEKLTVPKARIDLDVLPLLFGKIRVEEVHVYGPQILAVLPWQSNVSAKSPSAAVESSSPFSFLKSTDMLPESLDVTISGGRLTFLDRSVASPATIRITLNDIEAALSGMNCDVPFQVSARCQVQGKRAASGSVRAQLRIDPSGPRKNAQLLPFGLSGDVSARAVPCSFFQTYLPPDVCAAGISGSSHLDLTFDVQRNGDTSLRGNLLVRRLALDHSLSSKGAAHNLNFSFLAKADGAALVAQHYSVVVDDSEFTGRFKLVGPGSSDATIECTFSGPRLPIATVLDLLPAGLLPPNATSRIRAMAISGELRDLKAHLAGRAGDMADSSSLVPNLLTANCILRDLAVSPADESLALAELSGDVVVRDGTIGLSLSGGNARWRSPDLAIDALRAEATLSPRLAEVDASANLNGQSAVRLSAKIADPFSASASLSAGASVHANEQLVRRLLDAAGLDSLSIRGPAAVIEANAKGGYEKLNLSLKTDLSEHDIAYPEWFRKKARERCLVQASATTKGLEELSWDEAQVAIGDVVVQGSGKIAHIGSPGWELSASLAETDVSKLASFCPNLPKSGLTGKLAGWFRAFPESVQAEESGSPNRRPSSHLCQAGLVLTTDGGTIKKLLAAQMMPDRLRSAAKELDFTSGKAKIEATANFPLAKPQEVRFGGSVAIKDMQVLHRDLPLALSRLSGKIALAEDKLHIERLTGALGQSDFELAGQAEGPLVAAFAPEQWRKTAVRVHLSAKPLLSDLRTLFGPTFLEELSCTEFPEVQLDAQGVLDDLALDVHVSPRGQVSWGDICLDPERAKLAVSLAAKLEKLARLSKLRGSVQVGSSELKITGGAADFAQPRLEFEVEGDPVRMADVSRLLHALDPNAAAGEFILSVKGELGPKIPNGAAIYSRLRANAVGLGLVRAGLRFTDISGSLHLSPGLLSVESLTVKIGQSQASLDARANFTENVLQVRIKSPRLNTEDFLHALSRAGAKTAEKAPATSVTAPLAPPGDLGQLQSLPFIGRGTVDASLSVDDFSVGERDFGGIDLTAPVRNGVMKIEDFKANFCHGTLTANLVSQFLSECGLSFETDFKMKDVKLEELLKLLGISKVLATGRARVSGQFQGCGSNADELLNFARGRFDLKSRDGVIKRFGILSKIFSLMDIFKVFKMDFRDFVTLGTPYKLLKCSATLDDGVLSTRDLVVDASSMKMTGVCDVDLMSGTIEATIGVFLMPTMGNIAHKIPFVGPVITLHNKTIVPVYFCVHGDLSNPSVQPLQVYNIRKGVAKVLRDLVSSSGEERQNGK
ncbi:MAG TPA: AsmA-like C-terminal domain-containing protein [bacterium]|nr:AsmA-like C-terminal domain-containing protein [bacterium]